MLMNMRQRFFLPRIWSSGGGPGLARLRSPPPVRERQRPEDQFLRFASIAQIHLAVGATRTSDLRLQAYQPMFERMGWTPNPST